MRIAVKPKTPPPTPGRTQNYSWGQLTPRREHKLAIAATVALVLSTLAILAAVAILAPAVTSS